MCTEEELFFMRRTFNLAESALNNSLRRPVGAVIVSNHTIISEGVSATREYIDPTAHAEIVAIRKACIICNNKYLHDCEIYVSVQPCSMCLSAILWAQIPKLYYACAREHTKITGCRDTEIFEQICMPSQHNVLITNQLLEKEGIAILNKWKLNN
jgi:tRNA(Arg) A34 adenosine deaminase TadA